MLFMIDPAVGSLVAGGNATIHDVEGLNYLALAAAEGSHRIGGQRRVLLQLAGFGSLHEKSRRIFERAASRAAQDGALLQKLSAYGVVVPNGGTPTSSVVGAARVIKFPLRWFDSSAKIQPTILVGENLSDAHVIQKMGEAGTVLANLSHLPLAVAADHGGGSSISLVLGANAAAQRICLCVVDSDRSCPSSPLGGTASTVQSFKNPAQFPLVETMETEGRDLENSLPDNFYQSYYGSHSQHAALAHALQTLTAQGEFDLRRHIDIERGIILGKILAHPVGSPEEVFWRGKLPTLLTQLGIAPGHFSCVTTGVCSQQVADAPCMCIIVNGNGSDILVAFANQFANASRYQLAGCLDAAVKAEWNRIGLAVASWCCAEERLRV